MLAKAVETLRRDSAPETSPSDPTEQSFVKAEKALQSAVTEFQRLQTMEMDYEGWSKLLVALEDGRNRLELIHRLASLKQ